MTERPLPYVGISGISESRPYKTGEHMTESWLKDQYYYSGLVDKRELLLGVKATHKTQYLDIENRYGSEWYPVGEEAFSKALAPYGDINAAQMFLEPTHVTDPHYRDAFVAQVCKRGSKWLNALQFDMLPWHTDDNMLPFLEKTKEQTGHVIILQAHSESMSQLGPDGITKTLGRYAHALDYILFDASHGKGVRMNPKSLLPFLDATYESTELTEVGFGVAGGLCASVVKEDLPPLLEAHPSISWDAEGKLHGAYEDGVPGLDWAATKQYLEASSDVLSTS